MSGPIHEKPPGGAAEQALLDVPLWLDVPQALRSGEAVPLRNGVPLPRGVLHGLVPLCLCDQSGARRLPVQAEALQRWPDGSIQWLLIDALVYDIPGGRSRWVLRAVAREGIPPAMPVTWAFNAVATGTRSTRARCAWRSIRDRGG